MRVPLTAATRGRAVHKHVAVAGLLAAFHIKGARGKLASRGARVPCTMNQHRLPFPPCMWHHASPKALPTYSPRSAAVCYSCNAAQVIKCVAFSICVGHNHTLLASGGGCRRGGRWTHGGRQQRRRHDGAAAASAYRGWALRGSAQGACQQASDGQRQKALCNHLERERGRELLERVERGCENKSRPSVGREICWKPRV